jgi:glutathione S-transferase
MLKLFQFPAQKFFPNISPFCVKLETYLKMAEIPYETVYTFGMGKNSKKLMPYIEYDGQIKGDTTLIIDWLVEKHGDKVDFWLNDEQKAISWAFISMVENHIYSFGLYYRWVDPKGWPQFRDLIFAKVPKLVKWFFAGKISKKFKTRLYLQGISRFNNDEMIYLMDKDLHALSAYLGNKPFFFGDKPCLLDISVFSLYGNLIKAPIETSLKELALKPQFANLQAHTQRMLEKFYTK